MNSKARFQLSIAGLTVLLIAGLSGTFIMGVFLYMDGFDTSYFLFGLLGLGLGIGSLVGILKVNKKEMATRTDAAINGYHEFLYEWNLPIKQWTDFIEQRLVYDRKESNGYGYVLAGILAFIVVFVAFSELTPTDAAIVLIGSLVMGFILGKWGSLIVAKKRFEKDRVLEKVEVHFAEKLIVLNGKLIMLDDFGIRLKSFQLQLQFDMQVLNFKVESGFGNKKSQRAYMIPVPEDKIPVAEALVIQYGKLLTS